MMNCRDQASQHLRSESGRPVGPLEDVPLDVDRVRRAPGVDVLHRRGQRPNQGHVDREQDTTRQQDQQQV